MKRSRTTALATIVALAGSILAAQTALADPIMCGEDDSVNYMLADGVTACVDSGVGNISGNPSGGNADPFMVANPELSLLGKSDEGPNPFSLSHGDGTWSIDQSVFDTNAIIFLGWKFGTGNTPDEWMVYSLAAGDANCDGTVCTGTWDFIPVLAPSDGLRLSHMNAYGANVPEPATIALLGLGLLFVAFSRRRASHAA